jgi:type III secretory pathway component EscS
MNDGVFSSQLMAFLLDAALLAGVPLAVATFTGLIVSFLQAITQIQDQTLSQTIKIAAIAIVLLSMTSFLTGPLMTSTRELFGNFSMMVR